MLIRPVRAVGTARTCLTLCGTADLIIAAGCPVGNSVAGTIRAACLAGRARSIRIGHAEPAGTDTATATSGAVIRRHTVAVVVLNPTLPTGDPALAAAIAFFAICLALTATTREVAAAHGAIRLIHALTGTAVALLADAALDRFAGRVWIVRIVDLTRVTDRLTDFESKDIGRTAALVRFAADGVERPGTRMRAVGADAGAVVANLPTPALVVAGTAIVCVRFQIGTGVAKRGRAEPKRQAMIDMRTAGLVRTATFVVAAAIPLWTAKFGRFEG